MSPQTQPEPWYTVQEAATLCKRTPKTIENLVSYHQLPRRILPIVKNRMRRRRMLLSSTTVGYLQRITLFGENPKRVLKPDR